MMAARESVGEYAGRVVGAVIGRGEAALVALDSPPLPDESAEIGAQLAPRASLKMSLASSCRSAKKDAQLVSTELGSSA
jgi:hypothetical protein